MSSSPSLNVSLTPQLQSFIAGLVASGRYQTASEAVRAALRLLEKFEAGELPVFLADGSLPGQDAMTGAKTTVARASNIRRGAEGAQSNDEADPRAQSVGE